MEQYLIIIDLDGTTLRDDKSIHPFNIEAIKAVSHLGHKVIVSTGRSFYASNKFYYALTLDTIIVNRNGAHIHHPVKGIVKSELIDKRILMEIINSQILDFVQEMYIEVNKDLYVEKGKLEYFSRFDYQFQNVYYNHELHDCNVINMLVDNDKVEDVKAYLDTFSSLRTEVWRHKGEYSNTLFEVFSNGVDKEKAVELLGEFYNIDKSRIIAIGDQVNDIGMIKYASIGVAVKNAISELKEVADIVLDKSNNEGAVGFFLNDFFSLGLNMNDIYK